jgi:hypothetical protein
MEIDWKKLKNYESWKKVKNLKIKKNQKQSIKLVFKLVLIFYGYKLLDPRTVFGMCADGEG